MQRIVFLMVVSFFLVTPALTHAAVVSRTPTGSLANGLIGYWTFDGKDVVNGVARDISPSGWHGNLLNISTSTFYSSGLLGQAFNFTNNSNRIFLGNTVRPWSAMNPRSVSFWVRIDAPIASPNTDPVIFNFLSEAGQQEFNLLISNTSNAQGVTFGYGTVAPAAFMARTSSNISGQFRGNWKHVVLVSDGVSTSTTAGYTLYVDGVSQALTTSSRGWGTNPNNFIGTDVANDVADTVDGKIDDFRLYNRMLTANEARALYNQGKGEFTDSNPESVKAGLVGYWTFDGKDVVNGVVRDMSGQGNHGNPASIASTTFYKPGKIGQGGQFDGVNDNVSIPHNNSLNPAEITISFWVMLLSAPPDNNYGFIDKNSSTGYRIRCEVVNPCTLQFHFNGLTGASSDNLTVGKWVHAVLVGNSSGTRFYLDGVAGTLDTDAYTNAATTGTFKIGQTLSTMNAIMDDVRVYSRVLSTSEITQLYNQGGGKIGVSPKEAQKTGLVGYWTFDGKNVINGTLQDLSGNGNTGYPASIATSSFYNRGKIGQGIRLDGSDDTVNALSGSSLDDIENQGGGGTSVSMWVKAYSTSAGDLVSKGISSNGNGNWKLVKSSNTNPARLTFTKEGSTDSSATYNSQLTPGIWHHVLLTWNGSMTFSTGVKLYRDGVLQSQSAQIDGSVANSDASNNLYIGSSAAASSFCDCEMDEVRIFNRVLTATEALYLYNMAR